MMLPPPYNGSFGCSVVACAFAFHFTDHRIQQKQRNIGQKTHDIQRKMVWNISAKLRMKTPSERCDTSGVDSTGAHSAHIQVNVYASMRQSKR